MDFLQLRAIIFFYMYIVVLMAHTEELLQKCKILTT